MGFQKKCKSISLTSSGKLNQDDTTNVSDNVNIDMIADGIPSLKFQQVAKWNSNSYAKLKSTKCFN